MNGFAVLTLILLVSLGVRCYIEGYKVFSARRPLFYSTRWIWFIVIAFVSFLLWGRIAGLIALSIDSTEPFLLIAFLTMPLLIPLAYLWINLKQYLFIDMPGESFLTGLKSVLEKLNLDYEQFSDKEFFIKSLNTTLVIEYSDLYKNGNIQLMKKTLENNKVLEHIIDELGVYFQDESADSNEKALTLGIIFGTLFIAIGIGLYFLFNS